MTRPTLTFLLLLALGPCFGQLPHFKSLDPGDLVGNARTRLVFEDQDGMVWFGSEAGLFRSDGVEHELFLKGDTTSNEVTAIFQDDEKRLWVGYEDGDIFHLKNNRLLKWQPEEGTPKVPITGFAQDTAGRIWFSTYGEGAYFWENGRLYNFNTDDGLLGNEIYVLEKGPAGRIWLGTDGGISICQLANGQKKVENLTRDDGLPDEIVQAILHDGNGGMWIGTYDRGVCRYVLAEKRFELPLPDWQNGIVGSLALFDQKELWIGTDGNGLWRLSLQNGLLRPAVFDKITQKSKISDLLKDVEGNLWVISNTGGIQFANRQFEYLHTGLPSAQAVLADTEGRLWVGTPAGLFVLKPGEEARGFQPFRLGAGVNVVSLFMDRFGVLWVGSFEKGVFCVDPKTGKNRQLTEQDGLVNNNVLSMDGANGHVWLATLGGVSEVGNSRSILSGKEPPTIHNYNERDGLGTNFIYKVFVDSQKRTWFGTDGQGISVLEKGVIRNFPKQNLAQTAKEGNGLHAVYSITEDSKGHIWLSTASQGIFEFDGHRFTRLSRKERVQDIAATSLVTDASGRLVIVHPGGIDLLDPQTHHLIYYNEEIGITELDPNLNATCTDQWGNVWVAVKNGLIKLTPLAERLEIHPRTKLKTVFASFESVDFHQTTTFRHEQNSLVFEYVGLWYTHPGKVRYRYKLEGYDEGWIYSKDRRATYSQLPPGHYTFRVASTENEAWLDEPEVSYAFEVQLPVWQRWWFVTVAAVGLFGALYGLLKLRDKRLQRVHLLEKEKVESELAAIKAQINPHFLFNSFNTLIAVIEEDPPAAVEYTEKLSDFFRMVLQLRDKELIALQEEADLVNNYGYLLQKRYGENFRLDNKLMGCQGQIIPLTLQILVENTVKHNVISKAKPLTVTIEMEGSSAVSVSNNLQPKAQPEPSTQFGLSSLQRRYGIMGKTLLVEKTDDQFRVIVPLL